jgi:DNA processing protein
MPLPHSWTHDDVWGLSLLPRMKATALRAAVERYESLEALLEDAPPEFANVGILRGTLFPSRAQDNIRDVLEAQRERCELAATRTVTYWDDDYPALLRHIFYPPVVLYVRGTLCSSDAAGIAIVGTRFHTDYGQYCAEHYAKAFAAAGVVVVSGLAKGIDSLAHRAALAVGGSTYAVIASGTDRITAVTQRQIASEMMASQSSAILSEYPCGVAALPGYFPQRNRIISGLAKATVVIESGDKGGSLITARFALDQNRELFAVPGKIFAERSKGTNTLIQRSQAQLTTSPDDVLAALGWQPAAVAGEASAPKPNGAEMPPAEAQKRALLAAPNGEMLTPDELNVLRHLTAEPIHIDALAEKSSVPTSDLLVVMLELEFKNAVRQLAGKQFVRVD